MFDLLNKDIKPNQAQVCTLLSIHNLTCFNLMSELSIQAQANQSSASDVLIIIFQLCLIDYLTHQVASLFGF